MIKSPEKLRQKVAATRPHIPTLNLSQLEQNAQTLLATPRRELSLENCLATARKLDGEIKTSRHSDYNTVDLLAQLKLTISAKQEYARNDHMSARQTLRDTVTLLTPRGEVKPIHAATLAQTHRAFGELEFRNGHLARALEQLDTAHDLCQRHQLDGRELTLLSATVSHTLAREHRFKGEFDAAEQLIAKTIQYLNQLPEGTQGKILLTAKAYLEWAKILFQKNDFANTFLKLKHASDMLKTFTETQDPDVLHARAILALSAARLCEKERIDSWLPDYMTNHLETLTSHFQQTIALLESLVQKNRLQTRYKLDLIETYREFSAFLSQNEAYDEALQTLRTASTYLPTAFAPETDEYKKLLADIFTQSANIYFIQEKYSDAVHCYQNALENLTALEDFDQSTQHKLKPLYQKIVTTLTAQGDFKKALSYCNQGLLYFNSQTLTQEKEKLSYFLSVELSDTLASLSTLDQRLTLLEACATVKPLPQTLDPFYESLYRQYLQPLLNTLNYQQETASSKDKKTFNRIRAQRTARQTFNPTPLAALCDGDIVKVIFSILKYQKAQRDSTIAIDHATLSSLLDALNTQREKMAEPHANDHDIKQAKCLLASLTHRRHASTPQAAAKFTTPTRTPHQAQNTASLFFTPLGGAFISPQQTLQSPARILSLQKNTCLL